jgi:tetratricopeptide (TPR) repeat protein
VLALWRAVFPLAVCALLITVAAPIPQALAGAQEVEKQELCANEKGLYSSDLSIEVCTFIIQTSNKAQKDLAVIYSYRCRNYLEEASFDRALQDCNEAIWLDRKYPPAYLTRGLVYQQTHLYQRAVADFSQVISLEPSSASAWEGLCRNEFSLGQFRLTISACSESLRLMPSNAIALVTRGLAYLMSGAFDEAIADFDIALHANPALPTALYGRGIAKLERHDSSNGETDIAAAKLIQGDVAKQFADRYGIKPDGGFRQRNSMN